MSSIVAGCLPGGPQGRDITADEAPAFFQQNSAALQDIVALVNACRPIARGGDNVVWLDADIASLHCAKGDDKPIVKMLARLKALNAVAVSYYAADASLAHKPLAPLRNVDIIMFASGLGVSGSMTQVSYSAEPQTAPVMEERREDGSLLRREQALTAAPFHWFWEHTD